MASKHNSKAAMRGQDRMSILLDTRSGLVTEQTGSIEEGTQ
jgi:hypothetical protein